MTGGADTSIPAALPSFNYWITEAIRLLEAEVPDYAGAAFCARKATAAAQSDMEWARAEDISGIAQFNLGNIDQAITSFTAIHERLSAFVDAGHRYWQARALFNKGISLGALGRSEDEIAVYDDLLARFGSATEPALREQVAKALLNKGVTLGALGRSEDEIAVYDDLLARFGTATEPALREQVAVALDNKGISLGALGRSEEAMAVYDELLARFAARLDYENKDRQEASDDRSSPVRSRGSAAKGSPIP